MPFIYTSKLNFGVDISVFQISNKAKWDFMLLIVLNIHAIYSGTTFDVISGFKISPLEG